jgi:carbon starvation protein CstA
MIIADYLLTKRHLKPIYDCNTAFVIAFILTKIDFQLLWRYFSWANQSISAIALWIGTVYLYKRKNLYIIALIPAFFITSVLGSFLFMILQ